LGFLLIGALLVASVHAGEATAACDEARRSGDYHRAAECYRLAGEPVEADRTLARAFGESNVTMTKKASATVAEAKSQARRIREAFRPAARAR
jgi:hypothetical protein